MYILLICDEEDRVRLDNELGGGPPRRARTPAGERSPAGPRPPSWWRGDEEATRSSLAAARMLGARRRG